MKLKNRKGFTLIELLVVIAIIAVLSVVVILSLNPAELLRQARDSNRISDMATLKSAVSLYLADVSTPVLNGGSCASNVICVSTTTTGLGGVTTTGYLSQTATATPTAANVRAVTNAGWVPVNFTSISSGAPIGSLPVDPVNNATNYYGFLATSTSLTFKLTAHTESSKYSFNGAADIESTDGGQSTSTYEQGTNLAL